MSRSYFGSLPFRVTRTRTESVMIILSEKGGNDETGWMELQPKGHLPAPDHDT
jgi:hypothetical protein